ncbi:MAG TPA: lipocalin family protein [Hymenobacter sp.]|jgi:hypothetical protein|uniref:lipocalin family protein n=1 Tax=Hymenobacter sp. TaxID=1898978 RepID=UPI002EDB7AAE
MKSLSTYALLAAMAVVTVSCKKDDENKPAPTKTELLTAKGWRLTDVKIGGQSIYSLFITDACEKDNFIKFNSNKSATFDEGATKCSSSDPQTETGRWEFTTNETKLKLTDPYGDVQEGEIATLNSTTLVFRDPNFDTGTGTNITAELTFTAQ